MPDAYGRGLGRLPNSNMIEHAFPLRANLNAYLLLPDNLTRREVQWLEAFMLTLVDNEPEDAAPPI